jgi:hypothetical protein
MTVTQTVDIPASHKLNIDVPSEVPEGKAIVTFSSAEGKAPDETNKALKRKEEMKLLKQALEEIRNGKAHTPHADALSGILKGMGDITLEQIRDERLAKHLK